jgi:tetratricopeptide (TPR) repeat protein
MDPRSAPLPDYAELRRRFEALDARLEDPTSAAAARDALKGDIVLLFRETDHLLRQLVGLKEEVKELVLRWKALPAPDPATAAPAPEPSPSPALIHAATGRVDHLGASTFVSKGWSAISTGDYAAAEQALLRALELAPGDSEATALLGWALGALRRHTEALALLGDLIAREPAHGLARVSIGFAHLERGSYGEAIEHLARAARGDDDRKAALYANFYLGLVYQRREMYDDAVAFFRRALALGPNLLEAYYEMGRTHWLGGDRAAAVEAWRAGAAASKFNAWAKRCEGLRAVAEEGGDPLAA